MDFNQSKKLELKKYNTKKTYKCNSGIKIYLFTIGLLIGCANLNAQTVTIPIETENNVLLLQTDVENRLRTIYFGESLGNKNEYSSVSDLFNFDEENVGIYNSAY